MAPVPGRVSIFACCNYWLLIPYRECSPPLNSCGDRTELTPVESFVAWNSLRSD